MKFLLLIPVIFFALVAGITIYLQPNDFIGCGETPGEGSSCTKADAVVVVSGGDTASRTAAGIALIENGWADTLVLSGAAYDKTGLSNAAAMKEQAVAAGISPDAILIDEEAANTQQNAENSQSIFSDNDIHDVILVTSGYHQRRASLEFNKTAEAVVIRNHPLIDDQDWGGWWWLTPRGWWLAGGELVKIAAFYMGVSS